MVARLLPDEISGIKPVICLQNVVADLCRLLILLLGKIPLDKGEPHGELSGKELRSFLGWRLFDLERYEDILEKGVAVPHPHMDGKRHAFSYPKASGTRPPSHRSPTDF